MTGILCLFTITPVFASPDDAGELASAFGDSDFVSIATGRAQAIHEAPAVTTVITKEDIKATGATRIEEVLETIPGLHISVTNEFYIQTITIRGIRSKFDPHVLFQVNGVPMTSLFAGDKGQILGAMPVENVARIEVIRGPGSAIFGSDAFAGVINVITKSKDDIEGTEYGVRAGSFNTQDAWMLHGGTWGNLDVVSSLQFHTTDGHRENISSDLQTLIDNDPAIPSFIPDVSLAPGPVESRADWLDVSMKISNDDWSFQTTYQGRRDIGTGAGAAEVLDPQGEGNADRIVLDFVYKMPDLSELWDMDFNASYVDARSLSDLRLFPPGAAGGAFPDGLLGSPTFYERQMRLGFSAFYTGFDFHTLRIGSGASSGEIYRVEESKNFEFTSLGLVPLAGGVTNVTDTSAVYLPEEDRSIYYAYVQDEWQFANAWNLTSGLRFDDYSDFGTTVNPRIAAVWSYDFETTMKVLYGRAFRAPSFVEQFNANNPISVGNPDLDPEKINTLEWVADYHPSSNFRTSFDVYYYNMKDIIQYVPDNPTPTSTLTAQNRGKQTGKGFEWEVMWEANDEFKLTGNLAIQKSKDKLTGEEAGNAPQYQIYTRLDWRLLHNLKIVSQVNWVANRKRTADDSRDPVADYTTVETNLRYAINKDMELSLIGKNIFDADVREPSIAPGNIVDDYPLAGRSFMVEYRYYH